MKTETEYRYELIWRNKFLTCEAASLADMVAATKEAVTTLEKLLAAGVVLDRSGQSEDDFATLLTNDPKVAEEFGFSERDANDEDLEPPDEDELFEMACEVYFAENRARDFPGRGDTKFTYTKRGVVLIELRNGNGLLARMEYDPVTDEVEEMEMERRK